MNYITLITDKPDYTEEIEGETVNKLCTAFNFIGKGEWIRSLSLSLKAEERDLLHFLRDRTVKENHFLISCIRGDAWLKAVGHCYSLKKIIGLLNGLSKKGILKVDHDMVMQGRRVGYHRFVVHMTPQLSWLQARDNVCNGKKIGRVKSEKVTRAEEVKKQLAATEDKEERELQERIKAKGLQKIRKLHPEVLAG